MSYSQMFNDWYVAFSITGDEERVKERIKYRLGESTRIIVPKRRIRERKAGVWYDSIKTLFPGYVLLNGNIDMDKYYMLKEIPGLIRLLSSNGLPLRIDEDEIQIISRLICNDETIGYSNILIENGRVIVIDGPLLSMEGYIRSIDRRKGRAKVVLNFLGEERVVDIGISILQPA